MFDFIFGLVVGYIVCIIFPFPVLVPYMLSFWSMLWAKISKKAPTVTTTTVVTPTTTTTTKT